MKKYFGLILGTLIASSSYAAGTVCFSDVPSYNKVKSQLPPLLQQKAVYGVHKSLSLRAVFAIQNDGKLFSYSAQGSHILLGPHKENSSISILCIKGNMMHVETNTGMMGDIEIVKNGLRSMGYTFKVVDKPTYQKYLKSVSDSVE